MDPHTTDLTEWRDITEHAKRLVVFNLDGACIYDNGTDPDWVREPPDDYQRDPEDPDPRAA